MKLQGLTMALCGIALLSASCNKNNPATAEYQYTFQNTTNKRIHLDIYQTAVDYNNKTNVYSQGDIDAGTSYILPSTTLHTNNKYYIDWFSTDYTYTNWVNRTDLYEIFDPTIVPTPLSNIKKLETEQDYTRLLCLGGNNVSTTWQAVDGYTFLYNGGGTNDTNYWAQLPASRQNFTITFNRDYSATYSFTNSMGQPASVTIFCRTAPYGVPNGSTQAAVYLYHNASIYDMNGQLNSAGQISYHFTAPVGQPTSAISDTIQVNIDGIGSYKMVKKSGQ